MSRCMAKVLRCMAKVLRCMAKVQISDMARTTEGVGPR